MYSFASTPKHFRSRERRVQHLEVDDCEVCLDHRHHPELPLWLKKNLLFVREQRVRLDVVAPSVVDDEQCPDSFPLFFDPFSRNALVTSMPGEVEDSADHVITFPLQ